MYIISVRYTRISIWLHLPMREDCTSI